LSNPRILRFQKQSNFWRPRWFLPEIDPFQERIGGRLALICEADVAGKTIVTYNLHLESKGDDRLRCSQLEDTLEDSRQYNARTPVLLAGDFNLDASDATVASAISRGQFQDAFRNQHVRTTPDSLFADGRTIDWVFSRGPMRPSQPQVYRSVSASDHYPLSVTFDFI
jgi:endonuclease/exonuclease/phosphatase (EEP) superfamily protein YafD